MAPLFRSEITFVSDDAEKGEVCVEIDSPHTYGLSRTRAIVLDENGENARLITNCSVDAPDKVLVTKGMCT